ncbi:MAG: hypothetical protein M3155_01945, partial [Actinomycetota bacterium]|nr:hypothetical protein [Actinomycetota bacterium]
GELRASATGVEVEAELAADEEAVVPVDEDEDARAAAVLEAAAAEAEAAEVAAAEAAPAPEAPTEVEPASQPPPAEPEAGKAPTVEEPTVEEEEPGGAPDDSEGARLIALNMALNGTPREETDRYLAENFQLEDRAALLDEVYARVG